MNILRIAIWVLGALLTCTWMYGVRTSVRGGQGVTQQTVNTTMLFAVSLFAVLVSGMSQFHLLWMFPVSWLLGTLSLTFPFSLLSIPGRFFGFLCCTGLDQKEVARNKARFERYQDLVLGGMSPTEAKDTLRKEEENRSNKITGANAG